MINKAAKAIATMSSLKDLFFVINITVRKFLKQVYGKKEEVVIERIIRGDFYSYEYLSLLYSAQPNRNLIE